MALRLRPGRGTRHAARAPLTAAAPAAAPAARADDAPPDREARQQAERPALTDEVLIEEVSIDGMCGVY